MKGDGITTCVTCEEELSKDNIGYCDECIDAQVEMAQFDEKPSLKRIREYNESQRVQVEEFLNRDGLKLISRNEVHEYLGKIRVWGIISPTYAPHIDYSLVRRVARLASVGEHRKQWLIDYWLERYELEVPDFDDQVSLVFESQSFYDEGTYTSVYDYPGSMIEAFGIIVKEGSS